MNAADGSKLKKTVTEGTTNKTVDYLDGYQYRNNLLSFFPTVEGYVRSVAIGIGGAPNYSFHYVYNYTDHLGNIRLKYTKHPQTGVLEILEENQYYPFGLKHENYNSEHQIIDIGEPTGKITLIPVTPNLGDSYQYRFGGMEQQTELGLEFYVPIAIGIGARNYVYPVAKLYRNAAIGRWMNVDPLAEKYPSISPYAYVANNPIIYIDPDGKDIIPVHGTSSKPDTWKNLDDIANASNKFFGDNNLGASFQWSGGNYASMRTSAANELIDHVREQMADENFNGDVTLVGHSHGGNVSIEALNMMVDMEEFNNVNLNLMTINTPVRDDYQLSDKAQERVNHVNVYDSKDPVQSKGGNSIVVLPDNPSNKKGTGEFGKADRTFKKSKNIETNNPQGLIKNWKKGDYHNSHNRVDDWINKKPNEE